MCRCYIYMNLLYFINKKECYFNYYYMTINKILLKKIICYPREGKKY